MESIDHFGFQFLPGFFHVRSGLESTSRLEDSGSALIDPFQSLHQPRADPKIFLFQVLLDAFPGSG